MTAQNTLPSEVALDALGTDHYTNANPDATPQDAIDYAAFACTIIERNVSLVAAQVAEDALEKAVACIEDGEDMDTLDGVACRLIDALFVVDESHFAGADDVAGALVECLHVLLRGEDVTFEITASEIRCKRGVR